MWSVIISTILKLCKLSFCPLMTDKKISHLEETVEDDIFSCVNFKYLHRAYLETEYELKNKVTKLLDKETKLTAKRDEMVEYHKAVEFRLATIEKAMRKRAK